MLDAIGRTPLVRLKRLAPHGGADIWIKLEGGNPTGSYKDRVALAMVEGVEAEGGLAPGVSLLECTGGSTGTSVAFVCAVKGIGFTVISSDAYAPAKLEAMRALGAELLVEPSDGGRVTPDLWPRMRARAAALAATERYRWLDQFHNPHAAAGYVALGTEIVDQVPGPVDAFCGMVGTAGMIMGAGRALRRAFPSVRVVALEPESSAVLSGGAPGPHTIDGTAAGFVPPLFSREVVDEVRAVPEAVGREMARRLAREEGVFAGTSTGLNVVAACQLATEVGPGGIVVTVACDTGFKYLDGSLFSPTRS
jgi:cysteine synthase A